MPTAPVQSLRPLHAQPHPPRHLSVVHVSRTAPACAGRLSERLSTLPRPPAGAGFPNGFDSPSSAGVTGFVRIIHLLEEIADYGHSVFDLIATEAVDRCFGAVIEQFQPKQRRAINIGRRIS